MKNIYLNEATIQELIEEIDSRINLLSEAKNKANNLKHNTDTNRISKQMVLSTRIDINLYKLIKQVCNKKHITLSSLLKNYIVKNIIDGKDMVLNHNEYIEYVDSKSSHNQSKTIAIALDDTIYQHFKFLMDAYDMTINQFVLAYIGKILKDGVNNQDLHHTDYDSPFKLVLQEDGEYKRINIYTNKSMFEKLAQLDLNTEINNLIRKEENIKGVKAKLGPINKKCEFDKIVSILISNDDWEIFTFMCKNYYVTPSICLEHMILKLINM